ncbi:type II toxin-antitoxin system RelE/ParE family toxin [Dyella lutea]|jgi:toxin HigB-1|uniref:Type II toxin-antitoxin system RelE/ParE family toxin n=1 Tax=Dyella lutea TaxID=2950441 RepID=A0ABT1FAL8_9GAMM|nr:type II toxin-antitoxin system RelE/ParE family toxin [Dyella lutea]MCP1374404.1 type II toxin-antitoxin system RelE/ParE family toxin [Dyella lutea]
MIRSFADKDTAALANGERVRRWINIESVARRKLAQLHAAATLDFMRVPPGNRLEALKGDRSGQHSIRINDQFRVCFVWKDGDAFGVEITDYH